MTEKTIMKLEMSEVLAGMQALKRLDGYDDADAKGNQIRRTYKFTKPGVSRLIVRNLRSFGALADESDKIRQDLVKRHRPEGCEDIDGKKHPVEFEAFRKAFMETLKEVEEVEVYPITFEELELEKNPVPGTVQDILERVGVLVDERAAKAAA